VTNSKADARLRRRLGENRGAFGLALGAVIAGLLAAFFYAVVLPIGPPEDVTGVVEGFGLTEGETGSYPLVKVRFRGEDQTLSLPTSNGCRIGSTIHLRLQPTPLGHSLSTAPDSC
jgi:hypothetical protein